MNYCDIPFNMLVCGMTDCGKTHFILDLLESEFNHRFDDIVIFCPTIMMNHTYQARSWIHHDRHIYIVPDVNEHLNQCLVDAMNEFQHKQKQTLFIIDDCANLWESKNKCTKLTELAFSGRHLGISVWVLTQKYNAICKDFRENCKHMVIHAMNDQQALDQIFKENRCLPPDQKEAALRRLDAGEKLVLRRQLPWNFFFL